MAWINARQRHEADQVQESYRIARIHAYRIVGSFVGKDMPPPLKWWQMPGDEAIKATPVAEENKVLGPSEFMRAFGAAFGLN